MRLLTGIMLFATALIASADNVIPESGEYTGLGQDYNLGHDRDDKHGSTEHGHSDNHDDKPDSTEHGHSDNHGDEPDGTEYSHTDTYDDEPDTTERGHSDDHGDEPVKTNSGHHAHDEDMWIMRPELAEATITVTDSGELLIAGGSPALSWEGDKWVGKHHESSHVEVTLQAFPTMNLFELLVFEDDAAVSGTRYYMVKTK